MMYLVGFQEWQTSAFTMEKCLWMVFLIGLGVSVYVLLGFFFKMPELRELWDSFARRRKRS